MRRRRWGSKSGMLVLMLVTAVASCSGDQDGSAPGPTKGELEGMVSSEVANALDSNGRFILPSPSISTPILNSAQAQALAAVWPKQFGPYFHGYLERGHGGNIDMSGIAPCGAPLYAESAFELPINGVPDRFSRIVGSYWLVSLCNRSGTPQVSLAIAATATDLSIEDGHIRFPQFGGNEFIPAGVPRGWSGAVAETPEAAVARAYPHTRQRIASVPVLMAPNPSLALPQSASWRLQLEDSVSLKERGTTRQITVREVYVGPRRYMGRPSNTSIDVNVPARTQTDSLGFGFQINNDPASPGRAYAKRRPGVALDLEPTDPKP